MVASPGGAIRTRIGRADGIPAILGWALVEQSQSVESVVDVEQALSTGLDHEAE